MKKKQSPLQRKLKSLNLKNKKVVVLACMVAVVLVGGVSYALVHNSGDDSSAISKTSGNSTSSTKKDTAKTVEQAAATDPTATSTPPAASPAAKPSTPAAAPAPSCLSKSSDNSYHYCAINLGANATTSVEIALDSHAPLSSYGEFIEWLKSDQISCEPASCSFERAVLSGSLTGQASLTNTAATKATVKAQNYISAINCGIGCGYPVPRERYRFNGFTVATGKVVLSYVYQCTEQYTADTDHEYPWLPGLKPGDCIVV